MAICTTKTAILSGGEEVVPVDRRAQGGPGVAHGQTVVRIRHRAQTLLQLVTLAALRPGPSDRLRRAAAAADAPNATAATADATASASAAGEITDTAATASTAEARRPDTSATGSTSVRRPRRRAEREMTRRRFGDHSRRQAHAVYLEPTTYLFVRTYTHKNAHRTRVTVHRPLPPNHLGGVFIFVRVVRLG